jgi:propanediol dehydratase large subunit
VVFFDKREGEMKRSKRFEKLEKMPINSDGFSYEWVDVGLITMESPNDPKPSVRIENGRIAEMDGKERKDFDSLDKFIADYGISITEAERSMNIDSLEIARMLVDIHVSRQEIVKICCGCTPAKLVEVINHLNVVEMMMAQMKMRARKTPANQAHATNLDDNPVLIAADAAEEALRGFAEVETTCALARYAPFNAIALMLGAQTGRAGVLNQCSMEEATELELGMRGFTSYAETLSVYGTETVLIDGGDTAYSKAFLASAYASRGIKIRFTSGTGSEVLMGNAEQKSMLYLEVRCLYLTKACGVQGIQNGSINAIPLVAALPNGFRAIAAENLIASMLNIEVAAGNDTAFTHSDFRRGVKLAMQFMPGTDYITSGFGGIPNLDNVFAGSNEDCDDYDDYYVLQRDMKVDGGIKPIKEEDAIVIRNKAAKVCQTVFRHLGLPEITEEEVEAATYAYCYTDMPPRNKAEDMKAATNMMERGITGFDIVKGLHENGFEDIAERVMNMLKQRVIGDYLHTSSVLDENFKVMSAINNQNDYMGPGTGYRVSDERWAELKEKFSALKPQDV